VTTFLRFTLGLCSSEEWISYYKYYTSKQGRDPLDQVQSQWVRRVLLSLPLVALPTIVYFILECLLYAFLVYCGVQGWLSTWTLVCALTVVQFMIFTPGHDAAHGSVSSNSFINGIVGRLSFELLGPIAVFAGWRILHLRHHKFTNDPDKDPDKYACGGPTILLPFRWLTTITQYVFFFLSLVDTPGEVKLIEKIECMMDLTLNLLVCVLAYDFGIFYQVYFYWMLPSTFCHGFLVFAFDFVPHYQHKITPKEDRYMTTSNIETYPILEPLLTAILHYQNYHLVHHLHPKIPFYRYKAKWEQCKSQCRTYPVLRWRHDTPVHVKVQ